MDQENSRESQNSFVGADFNEQETVWKEDEFCTCCNSKFGKIGFTQIKKYVCRFCYRGVCKKCSNKKMPHSHNLELQRTCDHCYSAQTDSGTEQKQTRTQQNSLLLAENPKESEPQQGGQEPQLEETQKYNEENEYQEKSHSDAPGLSTNREELEEEILNLRGKLSIAETEHHLHNKQLLEALEILKKRVHEEQRTNKELNEQIERECKEGDSQEDPQKLKQLEEELNTARQALEGLRAKSQEESGIEPATQPCKCFVF